MTYLCKRAKTNTIAMLDIVCPVSNHDLHLLQDRVRLFTKFGGLSKHTIIFVPTKEVSSQIGSAVEAMRSLCENVLVIPMDHTPTGGWPDACNSHFVNTVYGLGRAGRKNWWYFMELDVVPTRANWADMLETERNVNGAIMMGSVVKTRKLDGAGQPFTEDWDTHMVGACIYPPDFYKTVHWLRQMQPGIAFDVQIRNEVRRLFRDSTQFQHMWGTINYQVNEHGQIECEDDPNNPPHTGHAGIVRMDAVVVHGCKDGSLAKLILEDKVSFTEGVKPVAAVTIVETSHPGRVAGAIPMESGLVKFDMGLGTGPALPQPVSTPEPPVKLPDDPAEFELGGGSPVEEILEESPQSEKAAAPDISTAAKEQTLLDRAKEEFTKGNTRISTLAEALEVNKDELKTLLTENGAKISGPGWVKWNLAA